MTTFLPHRIDEDSEFEGMLSGSVKTGFPSPAEDTHKKLFLNVLGGHLGQPPSTAI